MKKYSILLMLLFILPISVACVFSQETTNMITSKSQEADKPLKIKRKPEMLLILNMLNLNRSTKSRCLQSPKF